MLSKDILYLVFSRLEIEDLINVRLVCKKYNNVAISTLNTVLTNSIIEAVCEDHDATYTTYPSIYNLKKDPLPNPALFLQNSSNVVSLYLTRQLIQKKKNPAIFTYYCYNEGAWVKARHYLPSIKYCYSCGCPNINRTDIQCKPE